MYTHTPHYVRTPEELDAALGQLAQSAFVAIDTEFLRERTYYPKFCLLQMAHDNYCALIDVLTLPSLVPILNFLNERSRLKVLHAAHQDLEVLALANGAAQGVTMKPVAGPFFDSQVAAAFLDMPANIGYADLVQRRLQRTLDKGQARTDWSRRPLSSEQLTYAAADVTYLADLYHDLSDAMSSTPRRAWLEEDAACLEDPSLYATEPTEAWQRLRGLEHLPPDQRAVAKILAEWRERRAMRKDLPRGWILSDDLLRQIAERLPATSNALAAIKDIPRGMIENSGEELIRLINEGKAKAVEEAPASDFRPSQQQQKVVRSLMEFVRERGSKLHVSPEYLTTRREIEALVYSGVIGGIGDGWRFENFGRELIAIAAQERERMAPQGERPSPRNARDLARSNQGAADEDPVTLQSESPGAATPTRSTSS